MTKSSGTIAVWVVPHDITPPRPHKPKNCNEPKGTSPGAAKIIFVLKWNGSYSKQVNENFSDEDK